MIYRKFSHNIKDNLQNKRNNFRYIHISSITHMVNLKKIYFTFTFELT